jgi:uncharacterized protein (TIGR02145 family)
MTIKTNPYSLFIQLFLIIASLFFTFESCKKDDNQTVKTGYVPDVKTLNINCITQSSTTVRGEINYNGGSEVTSRGICWSVNFTPTIESNKIINGSGNGQFSVDIIGLPENTTLKVRAFATNEFGTGYGDVKSVTIPPKSTVTVTDIQGNLYHTVLIGTQLWMVENLKTTKYSNGDSIHYSTTDCNYDSYCIAGNDSSNTPDYGYLYNWYAASDSRNICPVGWHVPSDADWTNLINYIGGNFVASKKLNEVGDSHWNYTYPNITNETGFTALPALGISNHKGHTCYFWSSTGYNSNLAWSRYWEGQDRFAFRAKSYLNESYSVRCLRD